MYHNSIKLAGCFFLLFCVPLSLSAQDLDDSGSWIFIEADNCCEGEYDEFSNGDRQDFDIPTTVTKNAISFELLGGSGGYAKAGDGCKRLGGEGAVVKATFKIGYGDDELKPGGRIRFIVGKRGEHGSVGNNAGVGGGGGGGTAVLYRRGSGTDWIILAVAGGGGGAYQGNFLGDCLDSQNGQGGRASENGGDGAGTDSGSGGTNGNGGGYGDGGQVTESGGGGGAYSDGTEPYPSLSGHKGYPSGGYGGLYATNGGWGFGGGGSGGFQSPGGGGGGYSGGGGGGKVDNGGGGGSYINSDYAVVGKKENGNSGGPIVDHGDVWYRFRNICLSEITAIEEISGFCGSFPGSAEIKVHTSPSLNCSNLTYRLSGPSGVQFSETGDFVINLPGNYAVFLQITVDGILGLIDSEVFEVNIPDQSPPTAKCKDFTLDLQSSEQILVNFEETIDDGSFDNCGIASKSVSNNYFTCSDIGTETVTLTVEDNSGLTSTCVSHVTIEDNLAPQPNAASLPTLTGECSVSVNTTPTATDQCGGVIVGTTNNPLNYSEQGTYTINWKFKDSYNNQTTQQQTIIVSDQTAPAVNCPNDMVVDADPVNCSAIVDYLVSATDNCDGNVNSVVYVATSSNVPAGKDRLLLVQISHFGNITQVTYDGQPMTMAIRQEAKLAGAVEIWYLLLGDGGAISATAQITGLQSPNSVRYVSFKRVDQTAPFGDMDQDRSNTLTVNARYHDMIYEGFMRKDGNSISAQSGQTEIFDVGFNSSSSRNWGAYKPATGGPVTLSINTPNGAHVALVIQAKHNTQFSYSTPSGSSFPMGITPVTFTATDKNNNSTSCSFNVTVNDTTNPTITCPDNLVVSAVTDDADLCSAPVNFSVTGADYCSNYALQQTAGLASGANFPLGTTTNSFLVTDDAGLTASCSFDVTVQDDVPPIANCQDYTLYLNSSGNGSITVSNIDNGSLDGCSSITGVTLDQLSFTCNEIGNNAVVLTATDTYNNTATCSATVTVRDQIPPTANCQDITVKLDAGGNASFTTTDLDNGSSDGCGIASLTLDVYNFTCSEVGANTVTLTAEDNYGNSSSCSATVTVQDNSVPTALCQDLTVQLDANGSASITAAEVDNGSNASCGIASLTLDASNFNCTEAGNNTVILTATDHNGHTAICSSTVTVQDNSLPTVNCQDITIQLDHNGYATIATPDIDNNSSGACGLAALTLDINTFDCTNVGDNIVLLNATDSNGNTASCSATVTIQDNIPPNAVCRDITVQLDANGAGSLLVADIDNGSSDGCGIAVLAPSQNSFTCADIGNNSVVLTAIDNNGNSASCSATITIDDNTIPTINCQNDQVVEALVNNCEATVTLTPPGATDDCGITTLRYRYRQVDDAGNNLPGEGWSAWISASELSLTLAIGYWKVQWQAKDAANNQNKCSFILEIRDQVAPNAVCFDPIISFNGETEIFLDPEFIWNELASYYNCGEVYFVGASLDLVNCSQLGSTIPVVVTVEDNSGNISECTANVSVTGLPCGWSVDPAGLGCDPGQASYNNSTEAFSLSSQSCYDPSYYRQNDQQGFIQGDLCGDGEIVAEITEVNGNGWAGISMRERNDPGAPMIQLMISNSNSTRREARMSIGAPAYAHVFQTQGKNWLRLSRSGNQFSAYHSTNGSNWSTVFSTQIAMSNCIYVGLITMNGDVSSPMSGTFENVSINNVAPLVAPGGVDVAEMPDQQLAVTVFPNPASEIVNLQLGNFDGKSVQAHIYNHLGQIVKQFQWEEADYSTQQINVSHWAAGTYIVEISSGEQRVSKKLVVSGY